MKLRSGKVVRRTKKKRSTKTVTSIVRRELRKHDELHRCYKGSLNATANSTALLFDYTIGDNISQGDTIGQRTGATINLRSYVMKLNIKNANSTLNGKGWLRMLVVRRLFPAEGMQNMFVAKSIAVDGQNYVPGDLANITQPINNRKFKVVMDKKIRILANNHSSLGRATLLKQYRLNFKKKLKYSTQSANATDIIPNLHVVGILTWDDGSLLSEAEVNMESWIYYTDN